MNNLTRITLAGACLLAGTFTWAAGQTSANYAIPRDTINNGTADMASANYRLASSVGDAVATGTITSLSFRLSNGFRAEISASPAVLNLLSVVSQKIHGSTTYKLTIDQNQVITGPVTVEPRAIGGGHSLVFHFDNTVTSVGAATALNNAISMGNASAAVVGGDVVVTLTNVADNKRLTVTINGLNGSGTAAASMGFLVGDVNNDRVVSSKDVSAMKARAGQAADNSNFVFDLNATGVVTASDVAAVKARATSVPLPQ